MFPLAVQYFTPQHGVEKKMIDFIENPDESTSRIRNCLMRSMENLGLSLDQMSGVSILCRQHQHKLWGTQFGKHKPAENTQRYSILKGNCHAHIVHNTVRHAMDNLLVDVENVVPKVYAHFSVSAKKREVLSIMTNIITGHVKRYFLLFKSW